MAGKGYWVVTYRKIKDQNKLAAYAKIAGPNVEKFGGKFLVRGNPPKVYETGLNERTVVAEYPDLKTALAAHDSPAYQEALRALGDGAERDLRICEGWSG